MDKDNSGSVHSLDAMAMNISGNVDIVDAMDISLITDIANRIRSLTDSLEDYLSIQENKAEEIRKVTKDLYDLNKHVILSKKENPEVLDELVMDNFDEEQIWQQIYLQNVSTCQELVSEIAQLIVERKKILEELIEGYDEDEDACSWKEDLECEKNSVHNEELSALDDEEISYNSALSEAENTNETEQRPSKRAKASIVDDKFFKLSEMEKFLEQEEKPKSYDSDNEDEDNDEVLNYFEYGSDGRDDDDDDSEDEKNQLHYSDFFDPPDDEIPVKKKRKKDQNERKIQSSTDKKKVKFAMDISQEKYDDDSDEGNQLSNSDDSDGIDRGSIDKGGNKNENDLSTFEARQLRLENRIQALEEEALKEKPWQMKGEVTASARPQNSLLEEYVEFDAAVRSAPVMTEKTTLKLEDIIKQRIKDKAWDDVERKVKPVEDPREFKKRLVLDQEKSKLSLAQIYEQEYLKQKEGKTGETGDDKPEEIPKEHLEIDSLMKKLFSKLDGLSNFHYTPKMATAEIKIVSNLPAITMEEVAPVTNTDASLLAPEEIKSKLKGDLVGKSERSKTDKKRARRIKKKKQRIKRREIEKKLNAKIESKKYVSKKDTLVQKKLMNKLKRSSNITQFKDSGDGKYVKSSKAFFSKLEDEVKRHIKTKSGELKKMEKQKELDVKKFKL